MRAYGCAVVISMVNIVLVAQVVLALITMWLLAQAFRVVWYGFFLDSALLWRWWETLPIERFDRLTGVIDDVVSASWLTQFLRHAGQRPTAKTLRQASSLLQADLSQCVHRCAALAKLNLVAGFLAAVLVMTRMPAKVQAGRSLLGDDSMTAMLAGLGLMLALVVGCFLTRQAIVEAAKSIVNDAHRLAASIRESQEKQAHGINHDSK